MFIFIKWPVDCQVSIFVVNAFVFRRDEKVNYSHKSYQKVRDENTAWLNAVSDGATRLGTVDVGSQDY